MPDPIYDEEEEERPDKPLVWYFGEVKTPPFSKSARIEAGALLRRLQRGEILSMPHSRPMPSIGPRCHELRIRDADKTFRIIYRIDSDAIVIADVFSKKTEKTPKHAIKAAQKRLAMFDEAMSDASKKKRSDPGGQQQT